MGVVPGQTAGRASSPACPEEAATQLIWMEIVTRKGQRGTLGRGSCASRGRGARQCVRPLRRARAGRGREHRPTQGLGGHAKGRGFPPEHRGTLKGLSKRQARPDMHLRWFLGLQGGVRIGREPAGDWRRPGLGERCWPGGRSQQKEMDAQDLPSGLGT